MRKSKGSWIVTEYIKDGKIFAFNGDDYKCSKCGKRCGRPYDNCPFCGDRKGDFVELERILMRQPTLFELEERIKELEAKFNDREYEDFIKADSRH